VKQVVQNYRTGELALIDTPVPACRPGGVLVRTSYSLISTGTELMKVDEAAMSLVGKARARPDQVAKVLATVASTGPVATYQKVMNKLDSWTPLGYSLAGTVTAVGDGVADVTVGDRVAAAGNEQALHAEYNWVPRNLFVRVPDTVADPHAAFATVGAIAMQGLRQAEPALGESVLVIGLGLIGQLAVQLCAAAGLRVLGADLDASRCALAQRVGAIAAAAPSSALDSLIAEATGGRGVDHVLITAGARDDAPVALAVRAVRSRGRIVDIGKCTMNFPWNACYEKELDVRFSRSYGPGRYDPRYEMEGRDYPAEYVRWTERRNMECFVDLLGRQRLDVAPLISHVADFDDAVGTYRSLQEGGLRSVAVLFRYPEVDPARVETPETTIAPSPLPGTSSRRPPATRPLRIGFIGAGNYAGSMLLPHLRGRADIDLATVVTNSALSARNAVEKFGFARAATDPAAVLEDDTVAAVFVVTRHRSHADLVAQALRAGKAVFVEKPLALTENQISQVLDAVRDSGNDRLHVGFNRRFAPLLVEAREAFGLRSGPATARYLVNAGRLPADSWYADAEAEGTRFEGEGGHFLDTLAWLLGARPRSVFATATAQAADLQITVRWGDGSVATITYATSGAPSAGKENLELLADSKLLRLTDFRRAAVHGPQRWSSGRLPRGQDKGQRAQVSAFLRSVCTGGPMPIPLGSLISTTRATLATSRSLASGIAVTVEEADSGS
jgi:predicted dehydrogenase/threonine dehydrogenase-like Zn-dependent dehydrogenase